MKLIFKLFVFFSILYAEQINFNDIQKYKQYQELLDNGSMQYNQKRVMDNVDAVNDITLISDENLTEVKLEEVEDINLFSYEYRLKDIKRFGESFFKNRNKIDSSIIPTSNSYILNKGDSLFINTYSGKNTKSYELKIDNNGNINIPSVGLIKVASLNFSEAKIVIKNIITKAFPNTKVIVDISGYSSIQVVVTGNVKVPGIYNLNSFSTIKDALIAANGLLEVGSYRSIDIIRNGKKIHTFDLYDLLNTKKTNIDMTLRSSDIISVGFVSKSISLIGKVKYEAIYEVKDDETFSDLMGFSGGFSFDATKESIKLTRYDENKELKTYILSKNSFLKMTPKDGDKIEVFNNYEIKEKPYIYVHGKVVKNDNVKYNYFTGMKLSDLYKMVTFRSEIYKDDDKNKNYENRTALYVDKNNIKIVRNNDDNKRVFLVSLDENFILEPFDEVEFFNYFETNPRISAYIEGEVYKKGKFFIDKDTTFEEFLKLTGGVTERAYKKEFELVRYKIFNNERTREIRKIDFEKALNSGFKIKPNDEIKIFTIPNWYDSKTITIKGEVKFPGTYTIKTGEKLSSVIERAGGFTDEAFISGALFTRESIRLNEEKRMKESMLKLKQQMAFLSTNAKEAGAEKTSQADLLSTINLLEQQSSEYKALGRLIVYLDKDMDKFKKSEFDIRLDNKDTLSVPSFNDTISVYGEVMNPNSFVYNSKLTAFDYIKKAGDLTEKADSDSIYIVGPNGEAKKLQKGYLFSNFDKNIEKGSTIVVPMQINQVSNILLWKEISQIVYQLAVTAASLSTLGAL